MDVLTGIEVSASVRVVVLPAPERAAQLVTSQLHTWSGPSATSSGRTRAGWVACARRSRTGPAARSSRYIVETLPQITALRPNTRPRPGPVICWRTGHC